MELFKLCFWTVWLLYLPGVLLSYLFSIPKPVDSITKIAFRLGLGIGFWPLFLLWSSVFLRLHLLQRWTIVSGHWVVIIIGVGSLISIVLSHNFAEFRLARPHWLSRNYRAELLAFFLLLLLVAATRWQQINHLVLPNWVDSIHHTVIAQLLIKEGAVPTNYAPFLNNASFVYHWGYHALVAWLAWAMGKDSAFQIATLILYFGQILNLLTFLMLYVAGRVIFGSRRAALWSGLFGTLVSWYPAYYTSWGRYPHLVGLLLFPPLLMALWKLNQPASLRTPWRAAAIILLAGMILIHVRITFFLVTLLALQCVLLAFQRKWLILREWLVVGLGALLLTAPWLWILLQHAKLSQLLVASTTSAAPQLNSTFPWSLLWVPGIAELTSLSSFGLSGWLGWGSLPTNLRLLSIGWSLSVLILLFVHRKRKGKFFLRFPVKAYLLLIVWSGLLFLLVQLRKVGLPQPGFINPDSVVITFFAPVSLAAAGVFNWWIGAIVPRHLLRWTTFILLMLVGIGGAWQMRAIVNSDTILAERSDLEAMHWIDRNLPDDVKFAVVVKPWIGATYVGSDGGYWISALTGRMSIIPPAIYTIVMPRTEILQINAFLQHWMKISAIDDHATYDFLREYGVTHIYLGSKNVSPLRQTLRKSPFADLIYDQDSVLIFALHPRK